MKWPGKNGCASSKVATAGGAIGGRAGTINFESDGSSCDWLTFGRLPHPQHVGLYTSSQTSQRLFVMIPTNPWLGRPKFDSSFRNSLYSRSFLDYGQVAQLVERGPEKAGVGGSIPSLATNISNNLATARNIQISSREQYANIG